MKFAQYNHPTYLFGPTLLYIWHLGTWEYQKLFWPFTVWINCSSDLKNFANSWHSASNFKSYFLSLAQFFHTVGQNNFGNKIPFQTCGDIFSNVEHWSIVSSQTWFFSKKLLICKEVSISWTLALADLTWTAEVKYIWKWNSHTHT